MKAQFITLLISLTLSGASQAAMSCQDVFSRAYQTAGVDLGLIEKIVKQEPSQELSPELAAGWVRGLFALDPTNPFQVPTFEPKPILVGKSRAGRLIFLAPKSSNDRNELVLIVARDCGLSADIWWNPEVNQYLNGREGRVYKTVSDITSGFGLPFTLKYDSQSIERYGTRQIANKLFFYGGFGFRSVHGYSSITPAQLKTLIDRLMDLP